jgi:hypothetical protein
MAKGLEVQLLSLFSANHLLLESEITAETLADSLVIFNFPSLN